MVYFFNGLYFNLIVLYFFKVHLGTVDMFIMANSQRGIDLLKMMIYNKNLILILLT